jgi:hypothetical protein
LIFEISANFKFGIASSCASKALCSVKKMLKICLNNFVFKQFEKQKLLLLKKKYNFPHQKITTRETIIESAKDKTLSTVAFLQKQKA